MKVCGKEIKIRGRLARIAWLDGEGYEFLEDPEAVLTELHKSRTRVDLFTFIQKLSETSPRYNYPIEWDNMAVLPLSTFDHWWTKQIDNKTRNMVRKAERKALIVREVQFDGGLVQAIWEIYNECPVRQGRPFPHFGKDIETIRRMKATFLEQSIFIGAFLGEELIGFIKLVHDQARTQAGLMHILAMVQHRDKAPTNALVAQAVRACAERGIRYLWYANFAYGKKQRSSLSDFKENNGFRRVDIPRYYVPLTAIGRLALRLGLQHNALEWVPEPAAAAYRRLRSQWYARRYRGLENA
jgi:hypothetical protein